ncbi:hypothetical protein V6N13_048766 [Hibiscus sabdariffa]
MVTSEGQWAWDRFHYLLPSDVLEYIVAVKAPGPHASRDTPRWSWEDSSVFTVRSAYAMHFPQHTGGGDAIWKEIQHFKGTLFLR